MNWATVTQHPYDADKALKWDKLEGLTRLQLGVQHDKPDSFQMPGLSFHDSIKNQKRLLPCLTTPAPTEEGRPPPKRMKGKLSAPVKQRWLQGQRQYAPWVYEDHALVYERGGQGQILPAELKEQLHHYPVGFTRHDKLQPRDRHRLLGNSWHLGVARFLIALVLIQGFASLQTSAATGLADMLQEAKPRNIPVAGHVQSSGRVGVKPASDMWEQWAHSQQVRHPLLAPPEVEVSVQKTIEAIKLAGPKVTSKRHDVLEKLRALRHDMSAETSEWFAGLPSHVASAYTYDDGKIVQIPMLMRLLRGCGYPDCDNLEKDLCSGFPLLGTLRRSPGWHPRSDDRYSHPIAESVFADLNRQHIRERSTRQQPDPEWRSMLQEILQERDKGLIEGPFEAHPSWGFQAIGSSPGEALLQMAPGPAYGAFCL